MWDYQSCVRVVLSPLSLDDFARFLPEQADHRRLVAATRFYLGAELDFELELGLRADEVPPAALGGQGGPGGVALGRLGWLGKRTRRRDGQVIFRIPFEGART